MDEALDHPCRRCGAAWLQPCTDRAGRIRRDVHAARRRIGRATATASATAWFRRVDNGSSRRLEELAAGPFVTYDILDLRTGRFVYVGQSGSFAQRIASHLKTRRERPNSRFHPIRAWIWDAINSGISPRFRVLDVCDTRERSLASETLWARRLVEEGHGLLNRRREHRRPAVD